MTNASQVQDLREIALNGTDRGDRFHAWEEIQAIKKKSKISWANLGVTASDLLKITEGLAHEHVEVRAERKTATEKKARKPKRFAREPEAAAAAADKPKAEKPATEKKKETVASKARAGAPLSKRAKALEILEGLKGASRADRITALVAALDITTYNAAYYVDRVAKKVK